MPTAPESIGSSRSCCGLQEAYADNTGAEIFQRVAGILVRVTGIIVCEIFCPGKEVLRLCGKFGNLITKFVVDN